MSFNIGWRSFWWCNTALIILSLAMVIFMFPETKYERAQPNEEPSQSKAATSSPSIAANSLEKSGEEDAEKNSVLARSPSDDTATRDPWLGKGKPNKSQWGMYTPSPNPWKAILLDVWIPWKLFAFPIVEFSSFVVSWSCSSLLVVNLTQSQNFAAPPYNYSSQTIGFMNFATLVGAGIGLATAGPFSDWVSARFTRKNGGIRESEMRLPAMGEFSWKSERAREVARLTEYPSTIRYCHDHRQPCRSLRVRSKVAVGGHCYHRIYICWDPGRCSSCHGYDLRCGFV
jgi:hypothetical protein